MIEAIVFWVFAALAVSSAAIVVFSRSLISSAFALLVTFFSVAALYVVLGADFLGAVQLLVYVGGILVLQGYTPKQLEYRTGGPPIASHMYTPELLRESFAGMEILELREYEAELAEGNGHKGRSALVGLVARKPH